MEVVVGFFSVGETSIHADGPGAAPACASSASFEAAVDGLDHGVAHHWIIIEVDDVAGVGADDVGDVAVGG